MVGLSFDAGDQPARADWAAVASLSGAIAHQTSSLGLGLAWLMNEMLGRFVIAPHARDDSHRELLRKMARGLSLAALAISEPDVGAHPKHLNCRARRDGDHWVLDGVKSYVSNGPYADVIVVLAVTGEAPGRKSFDAFVVNAQSPGLGRLPTGNPGVLPPMGHCGLTLEGCNIPLASRLRTDGQAFELIARPMRTVEDTLLAGTIIGAMRSELDALASWLRGTAPPPAIQRGLGALRLELAALGKLATLAARQLDSDGPDDRLADLNAGLRIALEHWQNTFDAFAAPLDDHAPGLLDIARDIRAVLGIARGVGEARQHRAGASLLNTKEPHEVPA
jgi:acyl-CoA dehydrogenase